MAAFDFLYSRYIVTGIYVYKEDIIYDGSGNILQYDRNIATATTAMDALRYNSYRDSEGNLLNNKLKHVKDATPAGNYSNG